MGDAFRFNTTDLTDANLNKVVDMGKTNLARNGSFEVWGSSTPSGWNWNNGGGGTLSQETTSTYLKHGASSAKIVKTSGGSNAKLYRTIDEVGASYVKSRKLTAHAWVYIANSDVARIYINDGVGTTYSSYAQGLGFKELSVTRTCAAGATGLEVGFEIEDGSYTVYCDSFSIVTGECAADYEPSLWDASLTADRMEPESPHIWVYKPYNATIVNLSDSGDVSSWTAVDVPSVTSGWCDDNARAILATVTLRDSGLPTTRQGSASVADAGTIAHGLGVTPSTAILTTSDADHIAAVEGLSTTNITVGLHTNAGASVGTPETVYWLARYAVANGDASYAQIREKDDDDADNWWNPRPLENDRPQVIWGVIFLDSGGEFEYKIVATDSQFDFKITPFAYLRPI